MPVYAEMVILEFKLDDSGTPQSYKSRYEVLDLLEPRPIPWGLPGVGGGGLGSISWERPCPPPNTGLQQTPETGP